jgi:hypothetical protein
VRISPHIAGSVTTGAHLCGPGAGFGGPVRAHLFAGPAGGATKPMFKKTFFAGSASRS